MIRQASFAAIALVLLSGCVTAGPGSTAVEPEEVLVARVVDGDSIEVRPVVQGTEDVRLIGVDTPETAGSPRGAQPYGEEASEYAEQRLEGRRVTLRFDVEKIDNYGRALAYVYLPDGSFFNEELLERGYAQVATFPPNVRHRERFEEVQREAREAGRGIWSLPESQLCRLTNWGNGVGGCAEQAAPDGVASDRTSCASGCARARPNPGASETCSFSETITLQRRSWPLPGAFSPQRASAFARTGLTRARISAGRSGTLSSI